MKEKTKLTSKSGIVFYQKMVHLKDDAVYKRTPITPAIRLVTHHHPCFNPHFTVPVRGRRRLLCILPRPVDILDPAALHRRHLARLCIDPDNIPQHHKQTPAHQAAAPLLL